MTPDKFEKVESAISGWIARHKSITFSLIGLFVFITTGTLIILTIFGVTGMAYVDQNMTERHNAEIISSSLYVSEETMTNWNNIVVPISRFTLDYIGYLIFGLVIGYIIAMVYFIIRWGYRRRKKTPEV